MKSLLSIVLLSLLPLAAQGEGASSSAREEVPSPVRPRAYFGVVAAESDTSPGVSVRAVAPVSPAAKAGICEGDRLLRVGQVLLNTRDDLRRVVAGGAPGEQLSIELLRGGQRVVLHAVLEPRPASPVRPSRAEDALGADRRIHPIALPEPIRQEIRRHRRLLREQLAALPDGLEPSAAIEALNAIRNLARDAHATRPGWMTGRAGEISVRFRDEEGSVVLYGANNLLTLELYDGGGQLRARYDLNTPEERRALPEPVLLRLARLQGLR